LSNNNELNEIKFPQKARSPDGDLAGMTPENEYAEYQSISPHIEKLVVYAPAPSWS